MTHGALLVLLAAGLGGCHSTIPVKLELPVNRMELPERSAGIVSLGIGSGEQTYLTLTRNQGTAAPDTVHPAIGRCPPTRTGELLFEDNDCDGGTYLRGDARLGEWLQIGLRRSGDELLSGQAKVYLLGPKAGAAQAGDVSLAITGAYGRDRQTQNSSNRDGPVSTELERSLRDIGLIAGYRWSSWLMSYGGPYYHRSQYRGEHTRTEVRSSGGSGSGGLLPGGGGGGGSQTEVVVRPLDGDAEMLGANLGLRAHLGSQAASALLECARARIASGETRAYLNRCALGVEFSFLGRH